MSELGKDEGFWPGPAVQGRYQAPAKGEKAAKSPKPPKAKPEPVTLKPYVPRAPLQYQTLTDEDLEAYQ